MRPIGFSTGALAKGDFALGLGMMRAESAINAVELSALRDHELPTLISAITSLDLAAFTYVSFHAPSRLHVFDEERVFDLLLRLPEHWPIVVHPEILRTPHLWRQLGTRVCIENMDNRKTSGRTVAELRALFDVLPDAAFCLDLGHARQIDPTMASAILMLRQFGPRLRQIHVSDVGPHGDHAALGATARYAFAQIARYIPVNCPLIVESIIAAASIRRELATVSAIFEDTRSMAATA